MTDPVLKAIQGYAPYPSTPGFATVESIMALADALIEAEDRAIGGQSMEGVDFARAALRASVERVIVERDTLKAACEELLTLGRAA